MPPFLEQATKAAPQSSANASPSWTGIPPPAMGDEPEVCRLPLYSSAVRSSSSSLLTSPSVGSREKGRSAGLREPRGEEESRAPEGRGSSQMKNRMGTERAPWRAIWHLRASWVQRCFVNSSAHPGEAGLPLVLRQLPPQQAGARQRCRRVTMIRVLPKVTSE